VWDAKARGIRLEPRGHEPGRVDIEKDGSGEKVEESEESDVRGIHLDAQDDRPHDVLLITLKHTRTN
jgi:hypothetical protein